MAAARNVYTVGQVNSYIHRMFSEDYLLRSILVRGEVSNCKYHSSGHIYFTLKDASGTLSCVMFAGRAQRGLSFRMKGGDEVVVQGSVDVYEKTGAYQLYAERIVRDGAGLLNEKYELLKKKLEEMGMFAEEYKQPIPKYIHTLGVVTAPTGAAVRDIINISKRRNPYIRIILYPAQVQGEGAAQSIVSGIHALDTLGEHGGPDVDVIIIGRGGGSLEDLWAFNEEIVAQAVFDCSTPVISAVGHETDTVITDYVADLRAPTPSAAAELAVFDYHQFEQDILSLKNTLTQTLYRKTQHLADILKTQEQTLRRLSPAQQIRSRRLRLDSMANQLQADMSLKLQKQRSRLIRREDLDRRMERRIEQSRHQLQLLSAGMERLSPVRRLSGGYGFLTDEGGNAITSAARVHPGDGIRIRLGDGRIRARAEEVKTECPVRMPLQNTEADA